MKTGWLLLLSLFRGLCVNAAAEGLQERAVMMARGQQQEFQEKEADARSR